MSQLVNVRAHSESSTLHHSGARESGYHLSLHHWAIEVNEFTYTKGKEQCVHGKPASSGTLFCGKTGVDPTTYMLMKSTVHQRKTALAENNTFTVHQKACVSLAYLWCQTFCAIKFSTRFFWSLCLRTEKLSFKHLLYFEKKGRILGWRSQPYEIQVSWLAGPLLKWTFLVLRLTQKQQG